MNYSDFINSIGATFQIPVTNAALAAPFDVAAYNAQLPRAIDYIENRIQRELDFINSTFNSRTTLTANNSGFTLPTSDGTFVVLESIRVLIGGASQEPMLPMSTDMLLALYSGNVPVGTPSIPRFWAPYNGTKILVAPCPDDDYTVECIGIKRIDQLSSTNTSNALTTVVPDLYIAAGNVFWATFQRDFMQAQGSEPQGIAGFESVYQGLMKPALVEQYRIRLRSSGWQTRIPPVLATPPQT